MEELVPECGRRETEGALSRDKVKQLILERMIKVAEQE